MFRSFGLGLIAYGTSAAIFLAFSIFFVRSYGADTYGWFSLLLNTVSALTLFGNYHGALVSYAPAVERGAFRAMLRQVLIYGALAAIISALALGTIGNLRTPLLAPVAIAFLFIVVSGLPTSSILASASNWTVNLARAVYQGLLILTFWFLFAIEVDMGTSFALALLLSAAVYLAMLAHRVELSPAPSDRERAPRLILLVALGWNLAHMAVMLTDKFAIRYLGVGSGAEDAGVFLLYLDIAGRFSAIYAIGLVPLTYEFLRRIREKKPLRRTGASAVAVCVLVGVAVTAVGYGVIPSLYGIDLGDRTWLPGIVGAYVILLGFGSVFLAFCNSSGRPVLLLVHYLGVFLTGAIAVGGFYFAKGGNLSTTQLATALLIGQCFVGISIGLLVAERYRFSRRRAYSGSNRSIRPAA